MKLFCLSLYSFASSLASFLAILATYGDIDGGNLLNCAMDHEARHCGTRQHAVVRKRLRLWGFRFHVSAVDHCLPFEKQKLKKRHVISGEENINEP
ncbi:hypothetical protein Y032_0015g2746 [Ancylostoma ceylanicum]|uniref:Secreted protein n=1 Tax=Ancylostoma ceylanicum TaxID=53326 RepID=A0A016V872_9BILA|nr:hypothetical protein Y032_0015g2746 [Ancylostoma ceylanicum]